MRSTTFGFSARAPLRSSLRRPLEQQAATNASRTTIVTEHIEALNPMRLPSTSQLFEELDGRSVSGSHRAWRIEVFSMWEERGWRWVQMALRGECDYTVILKIRPREGVAQVLDVLSTWLSNPSKANSRVVNLA